MTEQIISGRGPTKLISVNVENASAIGGGTQYTQDAVAAANPEGNAQILVREDSPTSIAEDGDNVALRGTEYGASYVQLVTSAGAFIDSVGGGTQYDEGDTAATITGTAIMWEDTADTLRSVSAAKPLPIDVISSALPSGAATAAAQLPDGHNVTVDNASIAVTGAFFQATQPISAAALPLPSGAATSAAQLPDGHNVTIDNASVATTNAIVDGWDNGASDGASVSGDVAHDTADAGEPVKIGMKAIASGADPTEVAANDRTDWYASVAGVPWVIGGHPNVLNASINVTDADGAQTNTAIITVAANLSIVVTAIAVAASNANTVDVQCRIGFGTTTTPAEDAAGQVLNHPGIAAGSGMVVGSGAGIVGQGASNEDLRITCADPVSGSLSVNVTYYVIAI